jgi:hypothetical protein
MKLTRSIMVVLVGLSLSAPAAHACEIPGAGFFTWFYHVCHPDTNSYDRDHHDRNSGRDCHGGSSTPSTPSVPTGPVSPKS